MSDKPKPTVARTPTNNFLEVVYGATLFFAASGCVLGMLLMYVRQDFMTGAVAAILGTVALGVFQLKELWKMLDRIRIANEVQAYEAMETNKLLQLRKSTSSQSRAVSENATSS